MGIDRVEGGQVCCPRTIDGKGTRLRMSSAERELGMEGNHVHVFVRDLAGAVAWFSRVWAAEPRYREESMAVFRFGPILLLLDQGEEDTIATIGYATADCDADFRTVVGRGAEVIEEPTDRSWGGGWPISRDQAASPWNWNRSCRKSTPGGRQPRPVGRAPHTTEGLARYAATGYVSPTTRRP